MKTEHKIIVLSVAFFVFVCLIDAFVESFVFHKAAFWDFLIFDVPKVDIYGSILGFPDL